MKAIQIARKSGRRRGFAFAIVAALAVTACGSSDDASESITEETSDATSEETTAPSEEAKSTTLIVTLAQEPASWDYYTVGANALRVPTFYNVSESIVELRPDGTIVPMLAESWEISADGLVYTFKIRSGVKFHDGTDMDSADVVYSMKINAKSPNSKLSAPHAYVASVTAPDASTVVITLTQPSSTYLKNLGMSAGYVVPENWLDSPDLTLKVMGTGPFVFSDYKADTTLTLTRFEDYWGAKPYFEVIDFRFIDDETAALNGLLAGEYDVVSKVLAEGIERVESFTTDSDFKVQFESANENSFMWLSVKEKAFQDIRVRQAIAHAINREEALAVYDNYADVACLLVIPDAEPYNSDYCPYPYDPEKSKALLKEAGYENLEIDFPFVTVASHPFTMEVLTQQLTAVGIKVKSRGLDLNTWIAETWTGGDYGMGEVRDSADILQWGCKGGRNPLGNPKPGLCIKEFEDQLAKADAFINYDEHLKAMNTLVKTFADLAWVNSIAAVKVPQIMKANVTGIPTVSINNAFDLRTATWGS